MRFLLQLCTAVFVALAACGKLTHSKSTASLDVKLNRTGNTAMQVVLTNTGSIDLNLLNKATILGDAPNQKVIMYSNNTRLPFRGFMFGLDLYGNRSAESFTNIPVGDSVTAEFDAAEQYNLSAGGTFTAIVVGSIPYAEGMSTTLDGRALSYQSNIIEIEVDGAEAGKIKTASSRLIAPMTALDIKDSCEGELLDKIKKATNGKGGCRDQAEAGSKDAKSKETTKLYKLIFQKDDDKHKKEVAGRLDAIASQCSIIQPGSVKFYCEDVWGLCYDLGTQWSAAYAEDQFNHICLCDKAFGLPAVTETCHNPDLTGVLIHELTHLSAVYAPSATDRAYYWKDITDHDKLTADQAVRNSDSYRMYAQAAYLGCPLDT